jgi:hypothetical protein
LIGEDVAVRRELAFLDRLEGGVVLQTGDEEDPGHTPAGEQGVVDIAAVDSHNRASVQAERIGHLHVAPFRSAVISINPDKSKFNGNVHCAVGVPLNRGCRYGMKSRSDWTRSPLS